MFGFRFSVHTTVVICCANKVRTVAGGIDYGYDYDSCYQPTRVWTPYGWTFGNRSMSPDFGHV